MVLRQIDIHKLLSLDRLDRLSYPSNFCFTKRICSNADDRKAILLIISENSSYIFYVRYGISCVNAPNNGYNLIMYNSLLIGKNGVVFFRSFRINILSDVVYGKEF